MLRTKGPNLSLSPGPSRAQRHLVEVSVGGFTKLTGTAGLLRPTDSFPVPNASADELSRLINADVITALFLGVLLEINVALAKGDDPFYSPDTELKVLRSNICRDFLERVNYVITSSTRDTHHAQRDVSVILEVLENCIRK